MDQEQQRSRLKDLIAKGKEQGYLTYAEVNDHLPPDIADPEQIVCVDGVAIAVGVGKTVTVAVMLGPVHVTPALV